MSHFKSPRGKPIDSGMFVCRFDFTAAGTLRFEPVKESHPRSGANLPRLPICRQRHLVGVPLQMSFRPCSHKVRMISLLTFEGWPCQSAGDCGIAGMRLAGACRQFSRRLSRIRESRRKRLGCVEAWACWAGCADRVALRGGSAVTPATAAASITGPSSIPGTVAGSRPGLPRAVVGSDFKRRFLPPYRPATPGRQAWADH